MGAIDPLPTTKITRLAQVAAAALASFALFEITQYCVLSELTFWQSSVSTILFGGTVATLIAWLVLRKQAIVGQRIEEKDAKMSRAVTRMHESEVRYRRLFETAQDGILILDAQTGRVVDANPFLMELLGYSLHELQDKKLWEIGPFKDIAASETAFHELQEKDYIRYENLPLEAKDGRRRDVEFISNAYLVEGQRVIQCNIRDITERCQVERRLREREAGLAAAQHMARLGSWELELDDLGDVNRNPLRWSDEVFRIFGFEPGAIEVSNDNFFRAVHADDRDRVRNAMSQALREQRPYDLVHRITRPGGEVRIVRERSELVRDPHSGRLLKMIGTVQDVTEQQAADSALKESQQKLEAIINSVDGIVWEADARTFQFTFVSKKAERILGYAAAQWLSEATFWPDHLHPADRAGAMDFCVNATRELRSHEFEYRMIAVDGREVWLKDIVTVIAEGGEAVKLRGIMVDITERIRSEETLRRNDEYLRLAMKAANMGVWNWDIAAHQTTHSVELGLLFGLPAEAGTTSRDVLLARIHEQDRAPFDAIVRQALDSGLPYEAEYRVVWPDGSIHWLASRGQVQYDSAGKPVRVVGVALNITETKRAAEALRESNENLRMLIRVSPLAIVVFDGNANVLIWNLAAERIFGWTEEEVLGRPALHIPTDRRDEFDLLLEKGLQGKTESALEVDRLRKDGSVVNVNIWTTPLREDRGKVATLLVFIADNTERKSLEEQFRQAQKMEAVGLLAGGIAHDFNNLVTVISGYSELLLDSLPAGDSARESLLEIKKAAERAATLTRQLLAFSRKQVLEPKVLSLNAIVADSERILSRLLGEDVQLVVIRDSHLGRVRADPGQMEHVLMNLVVNARDAMPQGGKLTIETANAVLDESYGRTHGEVQPGRYVSLSVSDTGHGMDESTRARIFEPFFTTKEQGKGTGLGLAMVFGVIKQSGGHLSVHSEPGTGSTFKIYLPEVEAALSVEKSHGLAPKHAGDETILLVEDEDGVRSLARHALESSGYTVLEAARGDEAILLAEGHSEPIHLLISDVVMPEMDGRMVADQVLAIKPGIKVLFISGYTADAVVRHGVMESEIAFLQKPFTPTTLAQKVREVLDQVP